MASIQDLWKRRLELEAAEVELVLAAPNDPSEGVADALEVEQTALQAEIADVDAKLEALGISTTIIAALGCRMLMSRRDNA